MNLAAQHGTARYSTAHPVDTVPVKGERPGDAVVRNSGDGLVRGS
jgi:hypothetical protein